MALQENFETVH